MGDPLKGFPEEQMKEARKRKGFPALLKRRGGRLVGPWSGGQKPSFKKGQQWSRKKEGVQDRKKEYFFAGGKRRSTPTPKRRCWGGRLTLRPELERKRKSL